MNRRRFLQSSAFAATGLLLPWGVGCSTDKPKNVVVLGAGLAGLAAAYELMQAGHEVMVLEAQSRPGGRILTLRDGFAPGLTPEAGGMAFRDTHTHILGYVKQFDIPIESLDQPAIPSVNGKSHVHFRGKHLLSESFNGIDWPFELTAEERAMGRSGMFAKYMYADYNNKPDYDLTGLLPEWARPLDTNTLLERAAELGASKGAQDLIRYTSWYGRLSGEASAASITSYYNGSTVLGFSGGSDTLPLAFASRLGDRIRYGMEVVRIENHLDRVDILVTTGGKTERITADRAICTLPFSVLRDVDVSPSFSPLKQEIIAGLSYHPVTRVFIQVRERFWEKSGMSGGAYTDLPIGQIDTQPMIRTGTEGNRGILEAHARGETAAPIDAMPEEVRLRFTIEQMKKLHPNIDHYVEGGRSYSWQDDRWARGAYSLFRPGQLTSWLPEIRRPEGRIHFAGEHTSLMHASIEGAVASGVRAAREIG